MIKNILKICIIIIISIQISLRLIISLWENLLFPNIFDWVIWLIKLIIVLIILIALLKNKRWSYILAGIWLIFIACSNCGFYSVDMTTLILDGIMTGILGLIALFLK
jgi:hypothetical protein